jgi:hypothetical protein
VANYGMNRRQKPSSKTVVKNRRQKPSVTSSQT